MIGPGANQSGSTVGADAVSSEVVVGAGVSCSLAHAPLGIMIVVAIIPAAASAENFLIDFFSKVVTSLELINRFSMYW